MRAGTVSVQISGDDSPLRQAVARASMAINNLSSKVGSAAGRMSKAFAGLDTAKLEKFSSSMNGIALKSAAFAGGLGLAGSKAIGMASDFEETSNVIKESFGPQATEVEDWARRTAKELGRSTQQMRSSAGSMQAMLSPMVGNSEAAAEMSKNIAQLSVDLGSFFNVADDDALLALRSGLAGESEPMRRFGVTMTEASLQAFALSQGIKGNVQDMSEGAKVALRYAFIMERTKTAQGDAARTADSFANSSKAASAALEDAAVAAGTHLLPAATKATQALRGLVDSFTRLSPQTQEWIVYGGAAATAAAVLTAAVAATAAAVSSAIVAIKGALPLLVTLGKTLGTVAAALAAFTVGFEIGGAVMDAFGAGLPSSVSLLDVLAQSIDTATTSFGGFVDTISNFVLGALQSLLGWIKPVGDAIDWLQGKISGVTWDMGTVRPPTVETQAASEMAFDMGDPIIKSEPSVAALLAKVMSSAGKKAAKETKEVIRDEMVFQEGDLEAFGFDVAPEMEFSLADLEKSQRIIQELKIGLDEANIAAGITQPITALEQLTGPAAELARDLRDLSSRMAESGATEEEARIASSLMVQTAAAKIVDEFDTAGMSVDEHRKAMEEARKNLSLLGDEGKMAADALGQVVAEPQDLAGLMSGFVGGVVDDLSESAKMSAGDRRTIVDSLSQSIASAFTGGGIDTAGLAKGIGGLVGAQAGPISAGGAMVSGAAAGAIAAPVAALGVLSALQSLVDGFLFFATKTKSYARLLDVFDSISQKVVNALEPFWSQFNAIAGLFDYVVAALAPMINAISNTTIVGRVLFEVLKFGAIVAQSLWLVLAFAINQIVTSVLFPLRVVGHTIALVVEAFKLVYLAISYIQLGFLRAAAGIFSFVASIGILPDSIQEGAREIADSMTDSANGVRQRIDGIDIGSTLESVGDSLDDLQDSFTIDLSGITDAIGDLIGLTYDEASARGESISSLQELNEELTNVPQGFKTANARFRAIAGDSGTAGVIPVTETGVGGATDTQEEQPRIGLFIENFNASLGSNSELQKTLRDLEYRARNIRASNPYGDDIFRGGR